MSYRKDLEDALKNEGFEKFGYMRGERIMGVYEVYSDRRANNTVRVKFVIACDNELALNVATGVVRSTVPGANIVRPSYTHGGPEIALLEVTWRE